MENTTNSVTVNADETAWTFGNNRIQRAIQHRDGGLTCTALTDRLTGREYMTTPSGEGVIVLESGRSFDLSRDFALAKPTYTLSQRPAIKGGNVQGLSIHLIGLGESDGITVDVEYDIYPDNESWMTKWYTVRLDPQQSLESTAALTRIQYGTMTPDAPMTHLAIGVDNGDLHPQNKGRRYSNAELLHASDGSGVLVSTEGTPATTFEDNALVCAITTSGIDDFAAYLEHNGQALPRQMIVLGEHGSDGILWNYQQFLIQRWLLADCRTLPPYYKTWFRELYPEEYWLEKSHEADLIPSIAAAHECGLQGVHYVIWGPGGREKEQRIIRDFRTDSQILALYPNGFDKENPDSMPAHCHARNMAFGFHAFNPIGHSANRDDVANNTPPLVDFFKTSGARFCWYEDFASGVDTNLAAKSGWAAMANQVRAAIPGFIFVRTWIKEVESMDVTEASCPWDAHGQARLNKKKEVTLDNYYDVNHAWREWAVTNWYRPTYVNITMISCDLQHATGVGSAADLDFMMASQAFLSPMHVSGMINKTTPEQRDVIKKWVDWNWNHREIIQQSQPLDMTHALPTTNGVMHLTGSGNNHYGFIGIWNSDKSEPDDIALHIKPEIYNIGINTDKLEIVDLATEQAIPFTVTRQTITLELRLSPRTYIIARLQQFAGACP